MRHLALALVLLLPAALSAQQLAAAPDVARQRARLQRELDPATFDFVSRIVDRTAQRGLPIEPLLNGAAEGLTHRAAPAKIRLKVERMAQRLELASRALVPASRGDLEAGVEALGAGVPVATLTTIRQLRPDASVAVELGVLAQLVRSGVPLEKASAKIAELMRAGSRPAQIVALGDSVRSDVQRGYPAIEVFDARARGVLAAGSGSGNVAADGQNVEVALPGFGTSTNSPPRNNAPTASPRAPRRP
ncbi:MAG TPA: hypothetical protein VEA99_14960 [Gemmatimonadaceae bacterium]|nr:hypothetical protein [Gemmatimonadaceae bacterium]